MTQGSRESEFLWVGPILMKLSDEGGYYFAVNLQSDPDRLIRLQQAVDTLRREGKIDAISKDYGVRKQ